MIEARGGVAREVVSGLEAIVAGQKTLEEVVRWGLGQTPPRMIESVVVQDEYTHDVVLRHGAGVYLVYDTTRLGGVTAVAVWDHAPDADELLAARVARGWAPTPTGTRDGPKILGHAACLVSGAP